MPEPYPSCLIFGRAQSGRPLYIVCAPVLDEALLIIITTYEQTRQNGKLILRRGKVHEMRDLQDW